MGKLKLIFSLLLASRKSKFRDRKRLLDYQLKAIDSHLEYMSEKSAYFSKFKGGKLTAYPLMNKAVMMEHFDEMNTVGIQKAEALKVAIEAEKSRNFTPQIDGVTIGMSSGTSGNKGLFLVSEGDKNQYVQAIYLKVLKPLKLRKTRVALFFRANSNLYESVRSLLLVFRFWDLTKPLEQQIHEMEAYNPHILVAPPTLLNMLALQKLAGQLTCNPEKIISVAEVLEDDVRQRIEMAFGLVVQQLYQCTEGFLGSTCKFGTIHLHEDFIHFEKKWVDKDSGRFYPVITDFTRKTQPIIRYELNDILVEASPCPCGSVFQAISKIEGRSDDIFIFENSGQVVPIFPDQIRNCILIASNGVSNYQVRQKTKELVEFALEVQHLVDYDETVVAVKRALSEMLSHKGLDKVCVELTEWEVIPVYQKQRRIHNCL
jgi:putative adenylate-forming enzyme